MWMAARAGDGVMRASWRSVDGAARWLRAALLAVLFCFLWQAIVVQTHVHHHAVAGSTGMDGVATAPSVIRTDQSDTDDPANCALCQDRAQTDAYLLPDPVVVDQPVVVGTAPSLLAPPASLSHARSHAWQSRAPPRPRQP